MPPRFLERFSNRKVKQGTSITLSVKVEGMGIQFGVVKKHPLMSSFRQLNANSGLKLDLTFAGSPTPMVSWLKEESVEDVLWIKADTKGYKIAASGCHHSLILMDVGTEYTGAYTCIATNKAGQSICTAHLEVDDSKETKSSWGFIFSELISHSC